MKYIYNNDTISHTYCGQEIEANTYYEIKNYELEKFSKSDILIADIANGKAIMSTTTSSGGHIFGISEQIDFLKDIAITVVRNTIATDPTYQMSPLGFFFEAQDNDVTEIWFELPETLSLMGGELGVENNVMGDNITIAVFTADKSTQVALYFRNWYIPISGLVSQIDKSISDPIPEGFFLKLTYDAANGANVRRGYLNLLAYRLL